MEKQLCPNCQTGYDAYQLDKRELMCPYLDGYSEYGCIYFKAIDVSEVSGGVTEQRGEIG